MIGKKEYNENLPKYDSVIPFNQNEKILITKVGEFLVDGRLMCLMGFFAFFEEDNVFGDLIEPGTIPS